MRLDSPYLFPVWHRQQREKTRLARTKKVGRNRAASRRMICHFGSMRSEFIRNASMTMDQHKAQCAAIASYEIFKPLKT